MENQCAGLFGLYSNDDQYEPTATNAYVAESSDTEKKTTNHEITLTGLTSIPNIILWSNLIFCRKRLAKALI